MVGTYKGHMCDAGGQGTFVSETHTPDMADGQPVTHFHSHTPFNVHVI